MKAKAKTKGRPARSAGPERLNAWIDHVEQVLAKWCACPCHACWDCIDSVSALVPSKTLDAAMAERGRLDAATKAALGPSEEPAQ